MTSNYDVEMAMSKDGEFKAVFDMGNDIQFVIENVTDVRVYDKSTGEWIDIGYKGPVTLAYEDTCSRQS